MLTSTTLHETKDIFTISEIMSNCSLDHEAKFNEKFKELEEYLSMIVEDHNIDIVNEIKMDDKLSLAKAKAREYFKNSAYEVIRNLKSKFEENCFYHLVPYAYLNQIIDQTKSDLLQSFKKVNENILEDFNDDDPSKDQVTEKPSKKFRKGKTKIPKKALLVLKNWLTEHFNDPYPNYKEKLRLATESGITLKQVQNWFTNARGRIWRKTCNQDKFLNLVEEKLLENEKKKTELLNSDGFILFKN